MRLYKHIQEKDKSGKRGHIEAFRHLREVGTFNHFKFREPELAKFLDDIKTPPFGFASVSATFSHVTRNADHDSRDDNSRRRLAWHFKGIFEILRDSAKTAKNHTRRRHTDPTDPEAEAAEQGKQPHLLHHHN